ncbi:S4 domain-containing protein YaaA [Jeotgalibaca caeni]|uniref:S4 domain-containing protein YaaA n=1 Tax=Jeotgalibaca caeni TaxID=3028623 RepID=UPI00237D6245|nr:S4 domain-containing protein YaaA [Jeotgalibaca caeni]MDE1548316.1 S4 domain-containing protein YaaA [Jeotgalibaca caeni]
MKNIVHIDEDFITLGQLLKHVDIISSGGMAKWYLSEYIVYVDQEKEDRRGRKIYPGSVVEVPGEGTFVVQKNTETENGSSL